MFLKVRLWKELLNLQIWGKLTWDDHVDSCVTKANKRLGFIKRCIGYSVDQNVKKLCYITLVRPLMESSSMLWSGCSKKCLGKLESVQR